MAARALGSLEVTLDKVREQVESVVGYGGEGGTDERLAFTPRSKKASELGLREAFALGHNYIGTEHLLLGLVGESEGAAVQVLSNLGADPDKVRREVLRTLGSGHLQGRRRTTSGKTIDDWVGKRVSVAVENTGSGEPGRF